MAAGKLPVVATKGKPFERGKQYGTQAQKLVRRNVEVYFDMWGSLPEQMRSFPQCIPPCSLEVFQTFQVL